MRPENVTRRFCPGHAGRAANYAELHKALKESEDGVRVEHHGPVGSSSDIQAAVDAAFRKFVGDGTANVHGVLPSAPDSVLVSRAGSAPIAKLRAGTGPPL